MWGTWKATRIMLLYVHENVLQLSCSNLTLHVTDTEKSMLDVNSIFSSSPFPVFPKTTANITLFLQQT
jgi:hypothetical protein